MSSLLIPCPGEEKIVTTKSLTRRMMEPTKSRSFPLRHMLEHVARPKDANARPSPNGSHMGRFWHWRPRDKKCQTKQWCLFDFDDKFMKFKKKEEHQMDYIEPAALAAAHQKICIKVHDLSWFGSHYMKINSFSTITTTDNTNWRQNRKDESFHSENNSLEKCVP